jgi:hypothetical protein
VTIRKALIFYLSMVALAIGVAWAFAYYSEWWIGMILLTMLVFEHVWRYVKVITRNKV